MNCVECVVTPYNRYADMCFVESGLYDGVKLMCACVVLPRDEGSTREIGLLNKVKIAFQMWFQECLRVGKFHQGRLELEKEQARIFYRLKNYTLNTKYNICVFFNAGDFFIYKGCEIEVVRVSIQNMLIFTSDQLTMKQDIVGIARKARGSLAVLGNLLEKRCVSAWSNTSESTFFVICKDI